MTKETQTQGVATDATDRSRLDTSDAESEYGHVTGTHRQIARPVWWLGAGLAILSVVALGPSSGTGLSTGPRYESLDNPHFRGLGWDQILWAWTTFRLGVYQPLSWMSLEAEYSAWRLDPGGYHLFKPCPVCPGYGCPVCLGGLVIGVGRFSSNPAIGFPCTPQPAWRSHCSPSTRSWPKWSPGPLASHTSPAPCS